MQLIRCTQKLFKELKTKPTERELEGGYLGGWHANLIVVERKKCVLFTNDATLYSFFIPGLKKSDFETLDEIFRQNLIRCLESEELSQGHIEKIIDEYQRIEFAKTNNRSVLGSMNDLTAHLKYWIDDSGGLKMVNIRDLNKRLNRILMGAHKYISGIDILRSKLDNYG